MSGGGKARAYHEATKHTPESVRRQDHTLDWDRKPDPFKSYPDAERIDLPEPAHLGVPAMDALQMDGEGSVGGIAELARILLLGAGVLRRKRSAGGEILFRTYASAGALYPVEIYVVTRDMPGVETGVYHFDPRGGTLAGLAAGDARGALAGATAGQDAVVHAPVSLVLTGVPWRTTWKYTERGYRHLFWDAGTMLANILCLAASGGVAVRTVLGFDDAAVSGIVGIDGASEFPLALVALGRSEPAAGAGAAPAPPVRVPEEPVPYEAIREVQRAGALEEGDVSSWRSGAPGAGPPPDEDGLVRLIRPRPPPEDGIEQVIRRRGSARRFGPLPIPVEDLTAVLLRSTSKLAADVEPGMVEPFLIAHAVGGLAPGAYRWTGDGYRVLAEREMRMEAAFLCLEQRLGGEGAVTLFLLADLGRFLAAYGDRGYRYAQLLGGIVAGSMYLGFHAYGHGATGLTFYDDEVVRAFAPHSDGLECLLAVAAGQRGGRMLPLA